MKKILVLSLVLVILLGITGTGTSGYFSDTEASAGNIICAWTSTETECDDSCCDTIPHCIELYEHDGFTWTYKVTSGCSPSLSHWVLAWDCCDAIEAIYESDDGNFTAADEIFEDDGWECGNFQQTNQPQMYGIKFENGYECGQTRYITIVLKDDYEDDHDCQFTEGCIDIGTKAGSHQVYYCHVWGPICDCEGSIECLPGYSIIVSNQQTMVTEAYSWVNGAKYAEVTTTQPAVFAWEPYYGNDPSHWDSSLTYNNSPYTFDNGADWIWETEYSDEAWNCDDGDFCSFCCPTPPPTIPCSSLTGRVVRFERTFDIPCLPAEVELYITVDNGYTVWINGHLVGCAQVNPCEGWEDTLLKEANLNSHGWETVEHYVIPEEYLITGENTLEILAANEYYNDPPDDTNDTEGRWDNNPAGLIYWMEVSWGG